MHVLFGGTKLLQSTGDKGAKIKTPDGGCLAVVLRTGFGTAQGGRRGTGPGLETRLIAVSGPRALLQSSLFGVASLYYCTALRGLESCTQVLLPRTSPALALP